MTAPSITELLNLAEALGNVAIPQAEHDALTAFVEDVRDDDPNIITGRHNGNRDPQDEMPDLMEADSFRWHQDEAARLIPKPLKAAKVAA